MPVSRLDQVYRSIVNSKFFSKGWGKPENLKRLFEFRKIMSRRETCYNLVPRDYPISILKNEEWSDCKVLEGEFLSPFAKHLPGIVPKEVETAYFQVILPKEWKNENCKPMCIHLAGTGDHFFWRRRQLMAKPLLKKAGIGSILVENPFYGLRRPKDQVRSNLHNVSDIFVMGGCLMLESLALFHWCEREGLGPLGITGISMGGHMASLAATNWPKPLVLVPCLSWSTASGVFTKGVMSGAIHWDILMDQYFSNGKYREEIKKMLYSQEDAFRAGQLFAQNFPQSMDLIEQFQSEEKSNSTQGTTSLSSNQGGGRNKAYAKQTAEKGRGSIKSVLAQGMLKNTSTVQLKRDHSDTVSSKMNPTLVDVTEFSEKVEAEVVRRSHPVHEDESDIISMSVKEQEVQVDIKNGNEKKTTQNLLEILSPSKLMDTKNILAGFHVSKSKLLSLYSESEVDRKTITQEDLAREEALQFMRGIMDECTHLKNFDVPFDPELVIAVSAKDDGYVPQEGVTDLRDIWPGIEVRHLDAGHVSAYVLYQHAFRAAIVDAFDRALKKYNSF